MPRYRDGDRRDDRYRDDYDRGSPPPATDSGGSIAVKIIAVLGGALVLITLICGGVAWYVIYSVKQGAKAVERDVVDLVEKQQDLMALEQKRMQDQAEQAHKKHQERLEKEDRDRKEQARKDQQERKEKLAEKAKATRFANTFVTE